MKKLNEAQFRAPKWLRKYFDFEITTGKDVSPEAKAKRKHIEYEELQEEEKRKKFNRGWNLIIDDDDLRPYFKEFLQTRGMKGADKIMDDIRKKILKSGYYDIFKDFSVWLENKKRQEDIDSQSRAREEAAQRVAQRKRKAAREEAERKKNAEDAERDRKERASSGKLSSDDIEELILSAYNAMVSDFNKSPYADKFEVKKIDGATAVVFTFENGDKCVVCDNREFHYGRYKFRLSVFWNNKLIEAVNEMIKISSSRPSGQKRKRNPNPKEEPKTGDPKMDKYNLLKDKIKHREEQLRNMRDDDPARLGLENELKAYRRVRDNMKAEYKFEHLVAFSQYQNFAQMKS